jgi:thiol:disulfide interchange protein DsbA
MPRTLTALFLPLLALAFAPAHAAPGADEDFAAFGQYAAITPPQPPADGDRVEVVEMFWYGCPHCYDFEPHLKRWLADKPADVTFRRIPAVFRESWIPHARAFYAAQSLGVLERSHMLLFEALHDDNRKVFTRDQIADLFADAGLVDRDEFLDAYDSFAVQGKVKQAIRMTQRYGIRGVPSMVINGRYHTSGGLAGSFDNVLKVVDALVARERKAMTAAVATDGTGP